MELESSYEPRLYRASSGRSTARRLQRMAVDGQLLRVSPGVYVRPDEWGGLDARQQHLMKIRAVAPRLPRGAVLSHLSAAAVRGLVNIGRWPDRVQVVVRQGRHRVSGVAMRTATSVALRPDTVPQTVPQTVPDTFVGVEVVGAAETAVGAVIDTQFAAAVILLDDALRSGLSTGAVDELAERFEGRGRRHLDRVRAASDVRHESVGESFCAARLAELGLSDVVPQHEFVFEDGSVARVDFWLPSRRIVIEFDGRQKYTDRDMLGGRSPDDVLWDEKRREDRIRPLVDAFVRVRWWHLVDPDRLRALLRSHGVVL